MNKEVIKKYFYWHLLLTNEHSLAYQQPSYYGGFELTQDLLWVPSKRWIDPEMERKLRKYALDEIQEYGIDWDATKTPKMESHLGFNGTGRKSSETSYLEGTIVLNNGTEIEWILSEEDYTIDPFDIVGFLLMKEDHTKFKMKV